MILTGIGQRIRDKDLVFTGHIDIDRMIVKLIKDKFSFQSIGCRSIDSYSKKTMEQISLLSPGIIIMDFKYHASYSSLNVEQRGNGRSDRSIMDDIRDPNTGDNSISKGTVVLRRKDRTCQLIRSCFGHIFRKIRPGEGELCFVGLTVL